LGNTPEPHDLSSPPSTALSTFARSHLSFRPSAACPRPLFACFRSSPSHPTEYMRLHLAPHTRQNSAFFWEMNFSSVQIRLHWVPYSVMFVLDAFSICTHLTNVRLSRTRLAITSLLMPFITTFPPSVSHSRLDWKGSSLVRTGVPLHSLTSSLKLHVVACDHLSVHYPPQLGTPDLTRTFTRIRVSQIWIASRSRGPDYMLGARKLTPSNPSTVG